MARVSPRESLQSVDLETPLPSPQNSNLQVRVLLQEWEADLGSYALESGLDKAISDENKRAVVTTESTAALRQHLTHAAALTTYNQVRDVAVPYAQAKRVWMPSAGCVFPSFLV